MAAENIIETLLKAVCKAALTVVSVPLSIPATLVTSTLAFAAETANALETHVYKTYLGKNYVGNPLFADFAQFFTNLNKGSINLAFAPGIAAMQDILKLADSTLVSGGQPNAENSLKYRYSPQSWSNKAIQEKAAASINQIQDNFFSNIARYAAAPPIALKADGTPEDANIAADVARATALFAPQQSATVPVGSGSGPVTATGATAQQKDLSTTPPPITTPTLGTQVLSGYSPTIDDSKSGAVSGGGGSSDSPPKDGNKKKKRSGGARAI